MKPRRCGFGVPLGQLPAGDREAVEQFGAFLRGELALAEDGATYVDPHDPRATHFGYGGDPREKP